MTWENFSSFEKIYSPDEIELVLNNYINKDIVKNNKKIVYYNIPCAFDIETSSFYNEQGEKCAIMYEWTFGIDGVVIIGRTWQEFFKMYNKIVDILNLSINYRLIIYVHNLAFEFQFIRKWIKWKNIFSLNERKPCYALSHEGIEFRCSYLLSGYSLNYLHTQLTKYKIKKMYGDLDYSLIRHSTTLLTDKELKYCENDVRVVMSYIQEQIENLGNITKIPYTKTGFVRNYCRNCCMYEGSHKNNIDKYFDYRKLMSSLIIRSDEYKQLKRAFQGGFTHANAQYSGKIVKNIESFDFTSSYPYVMISEKFPMSTSQLVKIKSVEEFEKYMKEYCCLFDVEFFNIYSSTFVEHPLSSSRCFKKTKVVEDNGRVVSADYVYTTLTEQDYKIIKNFYNWENIRIYNFRIYKKGYLPKNFVKSIIKLYKDKTELKDIEDKEIEYLKSKEMLNSCYGMTVTDICRDEVMYDENNEWYSYKPDLQGSLLKYNQSKRRFLFYPWGVWITAYARKNLFTGIKEFSNDYIYSDTDSIKAKNADKHKDYISKYNDIVKVKLKKAAKYHNIDFSDFEPQNKKGEKKLIGIWKDEGNYSRFKTLGAKRYIYEQNNDIHLTVSGVNKKIAVPYLIKKYDKNIFNAFNDNLCIPSQFTGKNTHTYIDDEISGNVKDYLGITNSYYEKSGVHLEAAEYNLSLYSAYVDYLKGLREYEN